jgi:hypothetical protein
VDEIKMNLLGKSCLCPGFSTLVCNLMCSINMDARPGMSGWLQEYIPGCSKEIYCTQLSRAFAGRRFADIVALIYRCASKPATFSCRRRSIAEFSSI